MLRLSLCIISTLPGWSLERPSRLHLADFVGDAWNRESPAGSHQVSAMVAPATGFRLTNARCCLQPTTRPESGFVLRGCVKTFDALAHFRAEDKAITRRRPGVPKTERFGTSFVSHTAPHLGSLDGIGQFYESPTSMWIRYAVARAFVGSTVTDG